MNFGFGKINGFGFNLSANSKMAEVFTKPNNKFVSEVNKAFPETKLFCKPLKVECEFCKEKIGLLGKDVFTKENKVTK